MTETERSEWLQERRKGIGSTDAAPICGLSPWTTALEVYLDKIGEAPPREVTPQMKMDAGSPQPHVRPGHEHVRLL